MYFVPVRKPFGDLLPSVIKGAAMLVWLDADKNRAGHANENLGRELLELFTLGIGHYSEEDVQQAARALTGWRVVGLEFRNDEKSHDDGEKSILGHSGKFTGDDLLALVLAHPATAHRLAWRICRTFLGEPGVEPAALDALTAGFATARVGRCLGRRDGAALAAILCRGGARHPDRRAA